MVHLYKQLQDWLQTGREQRAIMWMENEILQGRRIEESLLSLMPQTSYVGSPLLLKARGKQYYRAGALNAAKHDLELAVKGFASQTFRRPFLSAMSLWADLLLRTGELNQAATLLQFLSAEYSPETKQELDGYVPYVLGRAERLLNGSTNARGLLLEAFEAYVREGRLEQASSAMELLLYGDQEQDGALETMLRLHLEKMAAVDSQYLCYVQYAQALKLVKQREWREAAKKLKELPMEQLPYKLAAAAELQLVQALRLSDDSLYPQRLARLERLKEQFACDWELQYDVRLTLHEEFKVLGNREGADRARNELEAFGEMLKFAYMSKEGQGQGQGQPNSSAAAKPDTLTAGHDLSVNVTSPARGPWRVHCFGGFKLIGEDSQTTPIPWKRKKAKELFLYLLLEPNYSASKEQLAELLLPGDAPDKALKHLYVIAHELKRALHSALHADTAVLFKDDQVRLDESLIEFVDVEQYISLLRVADQLWLQQDYTLSLELYLQAKSLYSTLLPELPYLDWLEQRREFLQEKQAFILYRLGKAAEKERLFEQAELYYREWIELRPYQEEAYQAMLKLLVAMGRTREAERWYGKLAQLCKTELNALPSEETRTIMFGQSPEAAVRGL